MKTGVPLLFGMFGQPDTGATKDVFCFGVCDSLCVPLLTSKDHISFYEECLASLIQAEPNSCFCFWVCESVEVFFTDSLAHRHPKCKAYFAGGPPLSLVQRVYFCTYHRQTNFDLIRCILIRYNYYFNHGTKFHR